MGCGKSSVGKRLSELLCCRFMDLDAEIVARAGRSIAEIFAVDGESEFRRIEKEVLREILDTSSSSVLALGGGAVMTEGSEELVHEKTLCVYLKASVETLIEHLSGQTSGRPLLKAGASGDNGKENDDANDALRKRIMDLMSKRAATYERTAHIIIETDGKSIDEVAQEIVKRLQKNS
jgi:shikimate kinase